MEVMFEHNSFGRRLKSMLAVDFRRMFTTRFIYIMAGICLVMPILILVIAGLPFDTGIAGTAGIVMCMIAKICLAAVFVPIYLAMSVAAKQKTWLSMVLSFMVGMLLFMMIPMITPLDSTMINVILCLIGGATFSVGLGAVSRIILAKTSLV